MASREMLVGFAEVDEELTLAVFEEVAAEYEVEELNICEGLPVRLSDVEWVSIEGSEG